MGRCGWCWENANIHMSEYKAVRHLSLPFINRQVKPDYNFPFLASIVKATRSPDVEDTGQHIATKSDLTTFVQAYYFKYDIY